MKGEESINKIVYGDYEHKQKNALKKLKHYF